MNNPTALDLDIAHAAHDALLAKHPRMAGNLAELVRRGETPERIVARLRSMGWTDEALSYVSAAATWLTAQARKD